MRTRWSVAIAIVLLLASALGACGLSEQEKAGGWSGALPKDLPAGMAPTVEFENVTIPIDLHTNATGNLKLRIYDDRNQNLKNLRLSLTIYRWGILGEESSIVTMRPQIPLFIDGDGYGLDNWWWTGHNPHNRCYADLNGTLGGSGQAWELTVNFIVPSDVKLGFYRVALKIEYETTNGTYAASRGLFNETEWDSLLEASRKEESLSSVVNGVVGLLPEAGFTVAPPLFDYISRPNKVPDFGNYTTPVIRPGSTGRYNFTVTNRYNMTITNVAVTIEVYMWATLEQSKPLAKLGGPAPKLDADGDTHIPQTLGDIPPGGHEDVIIDITTKDDTPKGTYFVRHRISFTYDGTEYIMCSRGYFSTPQWEGFNYRNLYYQLNVSGIVPDSSFSVKDPVPLWPLATLIGLCVFFGALAVVFYLAEEHGPEYPRLKKALQYWTGKFEQRRRLMKQRLDELRREVDVPLEDDEG